MKAAPDSVADVVARLLKSRGVERVFALCGGHIMPIWMRLDAHGIRIVDVRESGPRSIWLRRTPKSQGSLGSLS